MCHNEQNEKERKREEKEKRKKLGDNYSKMIDSS
jgi:hypothetical protein